MYSLDTDQPLLSEADPPPPSLRWFKRLHLQAAVLTSWIGIIVDRAADQTTYPRTGASPQAACVHLLEAEALACGCTAGAQTASLDTYSLRRNAGAPPRRRHSGGLTRLLAVGGRLTGCDQHDYRFRTKSVSRRNYFAGRIKRVSLRLDALHSEQSWRYPTGRAARAHWFITPATLDPPSHACTHGLTRWPQPPIRYCGAIRSPGRHIGAAQGPALPVAGRRHRRRLSRGLRSTGAGSPGAKVEQSAAHSAHLLSNGSNARRKSRT